MKLAIGCDHGGFELKEAVRAYLEERQIPYEDFGAYSTDSVDYAPIAAKAARYVASGQADCGVLICSTGRILRRDDPPPQQCQHPLHGGQGGGQRDRQKAGGHLPQHTL